MRDIFYIFSFATICFFILVSPSQAASGRAEIKGTNEEVAAIRGEGTFKEEKNSLHIEISVANVWPLGQYDVSIHEFGNCADEAKSAGQIFDVKELQESEIPVRPAGYLGTLEVAEDGTGSFKTDVLNLTLIGGPSNIAGRSIILEGKTDPENSKSKSFSRIACGVIAITE